MQAFELTTSGLAPIQASFRKLSKLHELKSVFLPHAVRRMKERHNSEYEAYATLEETRLKYPGNLGCTVAERVCPAVDSQPRSIPISEEKTRAWW